MNDLYWITVIGNLSTIVTGIAICSTILFIIATIMYIISYCEDYDDNQTSRHKKIITHLLFITLLFGIISCFTPTTKELYMIYGVGGTIDYLQENPKAQEIPDKCINAIDKWLDMQLKEEVQNNGSSK